MKYYVSSITDVISEEADGDWEKLTYVDRTAELVSANGLGIELADQFGIGGSFFTWP